VADEQHSIQTRKTYPLLSPAEVAREEILGPSLPGFDLDLSSIDTGDISE